MNEHVDQRALTYAIAASLALHAALLGVRAPRTHPSVSPPAPLIAHLMEEERPAAPPPVAEPRPLPPPRKLERPKPPPKPQVARPDPAPPKSSAFTVAPAPAPMEVPAPVIESAPAPAPSPASVQQAPVAAAPAAPPPPDPATLIARYRHQFIGAAARYKRYPLVARDNGWEGDVVVRLEIGANGELAEMKVQRGSGHEVLDEQALEMFRLAAPQVPLPPALRGRGFAFDVRAVYSLKD